MATVAELKAVLKDTLEKRGVLGHLKARIRAEVFNALDDESEPRPSLSHENFLINELIREYLEFNKYKYTASVLIAVFCDFPPRIWSTCSSTGQTVSHP
ncbi:centrosomal protein 20 isoform 3-T4 [Dama dama]